jgi:4-hydroxy-tetrahydrodipicolinate reductase
VVLMKKIHVAIIGAGRLGSAIAKLAPKHTLINSKTRIEEIPFDEIDIFIDVSSADIILAFLPYITKPLIVGSTGHSQNTYEILKKTSSKIPLMLAPNFSYGIYLLKKLLNTMPCAPSSINETHHTHKKDTPSGTAKDLASSFSPRPPINATRREGIFGIHTASYDLFEEDIQITHNAKSINLFADGAIKALCFLYEKEEGLYTMDDVYAKEPEYANT